MTDGVTGADLEAETGILEASMMKKEIIQENGEGIQVEAERGESFMHDINCPPLSMRVPLHSSTGEMKFGESTAAGADQGMSLSTGRG